MNTVLLPKHRPYSNPRISVWTTVALLAILVVILPECVFWILGPVAIAYVAWAVGFKPTAKHRLMDGLARRCGRFRMLPSEEFDGRQFQDTETAYALTFWCAKSSCESIANMVEGHFREHHAHVTFARVSQDIMTHYAAVLDVHLNALRRVERIVIRQKPGTNIYRITVKRVE